MGRWSWCVVMQARYAARSPTTAAPARRGGSALEGSAGEGNREPGTGALKRGAEAQSSRPLARLEHLIERALTSTA